MIRENNTWLNWVKTLASGTFGTIGVIVEKASEECSEIAIRALPLVSPLPNAIGLFFVAQSALGFGFWQALTFALSAELALFGLVDVLLKVFDGYLVDKRRYTAPLWAAGLCALGMLAIIIGVVYKLEVAHAGGNWVLAVLPLISGVGAVALAVRRWDTNQQNIKRSELQTKLFDAEGSINDLQNQLSELKAERANQTRTITELQIVLETTRQHGLDLGAQNNGLTERLEFWKQQAESRPAGVLEPQKTSSKQGSTQDRRMAVLRAISQTAKRSDLNFTELAAEHSVSDTAIKKDVEWLVTNDFWVNGDTWKPTRKGIEWAGLEVSLN